MQAPMPPPQSEMQMPPQSQSQMQSQMPPQMQMPMQMPMPPQPNVMMPFAQQVPSSQFPQQVQPPPFAMQPDPFGPPQAMPMPSVMQPQALGGMWQQMSPLLQADNLALKYDGKIRTTMHQQFLMALADQILDSTTWNSLLSALNGFRMQNVRVLQQPVGPTAVQKQDVKFNGEEAMILSQLVQSGTYDRLKSTPILAMYEYFLTIDDYCMKCAELSEKCVRHLLAVRRQGLGGPATVMVETSDEGRLLPQRMSEEDLNVHKTQVPPPDFLLWAIRDVMPKYGKRRFENATDTADKLTGMEGVMSAQFDNGLTWVESKTTYETKMSTNDQAKFTATVKADTHIFSKTPYQRCVDEAVLLSHSFYNDFAAICEGLFRIHFLAGVQKLHAPDTTNWDTNAIIQRVHLMYDDPKDPRALCKPVKVDLGVLDTAVGTELTTHNVNGKTATSPAIKKFIGDALAVENEKFVSDSIAQIGDWVNAFDNTIVSGSAANAGLLQPKSVPWTEYGDNHIRKVLSAWTGNPLPEWGRRQKTQSLPRNGGAIGEYFGAYTSVVAATDKTSKKWNFDRSMAKAEEAKSRAIDYANTWTGWFMGSADQAIHGKAAIVEKDASVCAAPFPFDPDSKDGAIVMIASIGAFGDGHVEDTEVIEQSRTQARKTDRDYLWERANELAPHPIQHIGVLGRACAKVHFDNWLKRNYLFPLIRIFNEVCSDHADAELNCPPSTEAYPVISKDGNLYAAPVSQVGVLDPTTGRMTFPSASASASRCVLPGATPPPPVPGLAQQVGVDRQYAPQIVKP